MEHTGLLQIVRMGDDELRVVTWADGPAVRGAWQFIGESRWHSVQPDADVQKITEAILKTAGETLRKRGRRLNEPLKKSKGAKRARAAFGEPTRELWRALVTQTQNADRAFEAARGGSDPEEVERLRLAAIASRNAMEACMSAILVHGRGYNGAPRGAVRQDHAQRETDPPVV